MHSVLRRPLARAPDRPFISESGFNFPVPYRAVRANERQAPVSRFVPFQNLPIEFHVASVSTLGAPVRVHIPRREPTCQTRRTDSATAVRSRVLQHVLAEISGGAIIVACITTPSLGVAGTVDAPPGVRIKCPCVFPTSPRFARMTSGAAEATAVPSRVVQHVLVEIYGA